MGTQRQKTAIGDRASGCSPRGKKPIAYGRAGGKQELVPYSPAGANLAQLGWCRFVRGQSLVLYTYLLLFVYSITLDS